MSPLDALINALQLKLPTATEQEKKLYHMLRQARTSMPEAIVFDVINKINDLLPKAAEKGGTNSATYLFYIDLLIICFWAHRYKAVADSAELTMHNLRLENTILRERLVETERRLQLYETAEDLIMTGTIDTYMRTVMNKIGQHLPDHPRIHAFTKALQEIETTNGQPAN